jgi:hypothetical protein
MDGYLQRALLTVLAAGIVRNLRAGPQGVVTAQMWGGGPTRWYHLR